MSPEERLCQRVMQLSCSTGVTPAVSAALGAAVARYLSDRSGHTRASARRWSAWSAALALVCAVAVAVSGLADLLRLDVSWPARAWAYTRMTASGLLPWLSWRCFRDWRTLTR